MNIINGLRNPSIHTDKQVLNINLKPSTPANMSDTIEGKKHRTVGISMGPSLEQRARARAEALGLKFSTYVTQCVEAELKGFAQIMRDESNGLDIETAIRRAREYMTQKTSSIDFEADIETVLQRSGARVERFASVGGQRIDFLVTLPDTRKVAVECRYNAKQHYALILGQGLLLRSHPDISAVLLVVPYLEGFDEAVMAQFANNDVCVTTPDRLDKILREV